MAAADTDEGAAARARRTGAQVLEENVADGDLVGITWGLHHGGGGPGAHAPAAQRGAHGPAQGRQQPGLTTARGPPRDDPGCCAPRFPPTPPAVAHALRQPLAEVRQAAEQDRSIKYVLDLGRSARTATSHGGIGAGGAPC
ncbi:hypothetical protein QJS66_09745 [Kocuria rhizophila]|nr:hypothetical protein QJS66_09745 [Kocuria rhizophila]